MKTILGAFNLLCDCEIFAKVCLKLYCILCHSCQGSVTLGTNPSIFPLQQRWCVVCIGKLSLVSLVAIQTMLDKWINGLPAGRNWICFIDCSLGSLLRKTEWSLVVTRLIVDYNYMKTQIRNQGPWEPQISTIYQNVLNRGEVDFRLHSIPILDSLDYTVTLKWTTAIRTEPPSSVEPFYHPIR